MEIQPFQVNPHATVQSGGVDSLSGTGLLPLKIIISETECNRLTKIDFTANQHRSCNLVGYGKGFLCCSAEVVAGSKTRRDEIAKWQVLEALAYSGMNLKRHRFVGLMIGGDLGASIQHGKT